MLKFADSKFSEKTGQFAVLDEIVPKFGMIGKILRLHKTERTAKTAGRAAKKENSKVNPRVVLLKHPIPIGVNIVGADIVQSGGFRFGR
jgi:hypothetical protein